MTGYHETTYAIGDNAPLESLNAPLDNCEAGLCRGVPATHVIINTKRPGWCPVCDRHAQQWIADRLDKLDWRIVTVEEFEAERRLGLYDPR